MRYETVREGLRSEGCALLLLSTAARAGTPGWSAHCAPGLEARKHFVGREEEGEGGGLRLSQGTHGRALQQRLRRSLPFHFLFNLF